MEATAGVVAEAAENERGRGRSQRRAGVEAGRPDANFGRILAAYGGVFVAGSLLWGMALDGFRPDRWDLIGAAICLVGVAVIMYAPRSA